MNQQVPLNVGSFMDRGRVSARTNAFIYHFHSRLAGPIDAWGAVFSQVSHLGFSHICLAPFFHTHLDAGLFSITDFDRLDPALSFTGDTSEGVRTIVSLARNAGLKVLMDVAPDQIRPQANAHLSEAAGGKPLRLLSKRDPRVRAKRDAESLPLSSLEDPSFRQWCISQLVSLTEIGIDGFRCLSLPRLAASFWHEMRLALPGSQLLAWTPVQMPTSLTGGLSADFDYYCISDEVCSNMAGSCSSAPPLRDMSKCLIVPNYRRDQATSSPLMLAAALGSGLFIPMVDKGRTTFPMDDLSVPRCTKAWTSGEIREAIRFGRSLSTPAHVRRLPKSGSQSYVLLRADHSNIEAGESVLRLSVKASPWGSQILHPDTDEMHLMPATVPRGSAKPLHRYPLDHEPRPRVAIEAVSPSVADGDFPVKTVIGRPMSFTCDLILEGHGQISADLLWKAEDEVTWHRQPMQPSGNDQWNAKFTPDRIGRYAVCIEAWPHTWGNFLHDSKLKQIAGVDISLDLIEGKAVASATNSEVNGRLDPHVSDLWSPDLAHTTRVSAPRHFSTRSLVTNVRVDRLKADFSSWYELFPRSATDDARKSGTLLSVIDRLSAIREMGFDVLYFPPIHPIGRTNRKGRNNSLNAAPDDVGSPYAIGGQAGGHDALHPDLGDLNAFRQLVQAASDNGLEIALDFATQCSPDHPWMRDHKEWFRIRADGTVRYAENPPKRYEDIVNPEFYGEGSFPALWNEIRRILLFWIEEGVRIFRVDNPHTKPFPFWEWLMASLQDDYPDVVFLAEAFTRPKLMYRLAKIGFSQSYSYFTWRNSKDELAQFGREISTPPVSDFFRANLFANTPDINPFYLQQNGRPGFLVRAVLAATLSGSWGIYSGFELCEAEPLPNREEYFNSEKYEIKVRDFESPINIISEVSRLNQLRYAYSGAWSRPEVSFHDTSDPGVLCYSRGNNSDGGILLIAVNLSPSVQVDASLNTSRYAFGLSGETSVRVTDVWTGASELWTDQPKRVRFDIGDLPFRIWHIAS